MTEALNLSLAAAILDVNLKGPTATFDEMGLAAVRSAWLAVRAHLDTELLLGPGTPPDTSWNKRASPPGGEWQGIDTAPRDGTAVDLWRDGERLTDWRYSERRHGWYQERGYPTVTVYLTAPPTHFMPLPAPPREAVGVGIEGASRTESTDARCDATAEDAQRKSEGGEP